MVAGLRSRNADRSFDSGGRFLQAEFEGVLEVVAASRTCATPAAPRPEDVPEAKKIPENIGEVTKRVGIESRETLTSETLVTEPVVSRPFVTVGQHRVRLGRLLEFLLGVRIIRIAIRMVLHGKPAVGRLDFR